MGEKEKLNNEKVEQEKKSNKKIIKTDIDAKDGQNKCPKCGATDISLNSKTGKLRCNFCRHQFEPEKLETMEKLTITKKRFLEWYYQSGQDQENTDLKIDLANSIINQMFKTGVGSISVQELFDGCSEDAIRLSFTEQGTEDDYDIELGDLGEFEIQLV